MPLPRVSVKSAELQERKRAGAKFRPGKSEKRAEREAVKELEEVKEVKESKLRGWSSAGQVFRRGWGRAVTSHDSRFSLPCQ